MNTWDHAKDGAAIAAIVSSAVGCAVIGIATVLATASTAVKNALNWWDPAGPLTGKTGVGVIAWLTSWLVLHLLLRRREIPFSIFWRLAVLLIAMGWLGTFPPFFELFSKGH